MRDAAWTPSRAVGHPFGWRVPQSYLCFKVSRVHAAEEISQALPGVQLPVTLVFDYPSVSAMTELIMQSTGGAAIGN